MASSPHNRPEQVWKDNRRDNPWAKSAAWRSLPFDDHGWFGDDNREMLNRLFTERHKAGNPIRVVIEAGCWLGKSTRFFAERAELVIAIDHWQGSVEHQDPDRADCYPRLPCLYEQFLRNTAAFNNICPLQTDIARVPDLHLPQADLICVDASHDEESVYRDIRTLWPLLKPDGIMCGDDWLGGDMAGLRTAVDRAAAEFKRSVCVFGNFWELR